MLQLQQVRTHGKGMLIGKERTRNKDMFQMREERTYRQRLQKKADDEETQDTRRGIRRRRQKRQGAGFWRRSRVGTVREIKNINSSEKYIIPNRRASSGKKELNVQADIKTKNGKKLKVKALVDSGCTHTGIDEQLVKEKRIQTKAIDFSFEVFNADGTKNGEVTKVAPLEVEVNGHKETLEAAVTDLAGMDMFLGHDWLVKHNPEVNWKNSTIKFTRCPGNCTMMYKDIQFNSR